MDPKQNQDEQTTVVTLEEDEKSDQDDGQNLEQNDDQNSEQDDGQAQEEEDQSGETKTEEEENLGVEVVLESTEEASEKQPRKNFGKRIQKMNEKVDVAEQGEQKANEELEKQKARNADLEDQVKIQRLALEKKDNSKDPNGPPDPENFDAGEYDPEFRKQLNAYHDARQDARMDERFNKKVEEVESSARVKQVQNATDYALEQKQEIHYERAAQMGATDYYDTEDKVISVLGKPAVNTIIKSIPNAHTILYYLGKNPKKADQIAESLKADPVTGINDIAVLGTKLKLNKITKNVRNPDEELEGGRPASPKKLRGPKGATYS